MSIFSNPTVRLAGRAIVAGLLVFGTTIQAGGFALDHAALYAAAGAAISAALEVFTPLNAIVGVFKKKPGGGYTVDIPALQAAYEQLLREAHNVNEIAKGGGAGA